MSTFFGVSVDFNLFVCILLIVLMVSRCDVLAYTSFLCKEHIQVFLLNLMFYNSVVRWMEL
jgi:hypothetical protein